MSAPTILVVDDNQDSRTILSAVFGHCGYAVLEASDGDTAMRIAREGAVALVVSELYVPTGDAACLVEALKRQADTAALPIIVVSSRVMPADRDHARAIGCDAVLGKPFNLRDIIDIADRLLGRQRPATVPAALGPWPSRVRSRELSAGG